VLLVLLLLLCVGAAALAAPRLQSTARDTRSVGRTALQAKAAGAGILLGTSGAWLRRGKR
jgi:hypothetical protein